MIPHYRITEKILNLVQEISEKSTQLSFEKRELHLRKENRIRSIQSSLAIENNSLTLEQVTDIIEGKRVLGPQKDIHEVQNAYEAYEQVFKMDPYEINDFLLAHHLLMQGLVKLPGKFRLGDVGIYDSNGRVVHIGARAQFVGSLVQELFDWGKNSMISPIVKSCIIHFELEIIHPFEDGNGRIGRALAEKCFIQSLNMPIPISLSSIIEKNKKEYYNELKKAQQSLEITDWILFFSKIIIEAQRFAKQTIVFILNKSKFINKHRNNMNERQLKVLLKMFEFGVSGFEGGMTTRKYISIAKTSRATAVRDLQDLVEKEILSQIGEGRSVRYKINFNKQEK